VGPGHQQKSPGKRGIALKHELKHELEHRLLLGPLFEFPTAAAAVQADGDSLRNSPTQSESAVSPPKHRRTSRLQ